MDTAISNAKVHVIPFPPGEAQGSRCAGSIRLSCEGKKKPQTITEEIYMEKLESEQEIN